jgi:O-antigen ligase
VQHFQEGQAVLSRPLRSANAAGGRLSVAEGFATVSGILAVSAGFLIPLSTSLSGGVLAGLAVCWALGGDFRSKLEQIRNTPVAMWSLALFALYAAAVVWSIVPPDEALAGLVKYRNLLYAPIFLTIFADERLCRWGLAAFEAAMLLMLAGSYLIWIGGLETPLPDQPYCVFKNRITHNVLMAFFVYLLAQRLLFGNQWNSLVPLPKWLTAVVLAFATYNVLFMVQGRTGYLVLAALTVLLMVQRWSKRGLAGAALVIAVAGGAVYVVSDSFSTRVDRAVGEFRTYSNDRAQSDRLTRSSIGLRLYFYEEGLQIIAATPWLGTGPGSFETVYRPAAERDGVPPISNPHSEYLAALIQAGVLGLVALLGLFAVHWHGSHRLEPQSRHLAQGVVVTIAIGCIVNSLLLNATEGNLYAWLTGLCFGGAAATPSEVAHDRR